MKTTITILIILVGLFIAQRIFGPFYLAAFYNAFSPGNVREITDISFADHERLMLDIYTPRNHTEKDDLPVLLFFHGGSWKSNNKDKFKYIGRTMASRGYITVIPNYRLVPQSRYPDQIKDAARALRWVERNIGEYGGSHNNIILCGHSAGGHLASLLAFDDSWLKKYDINRDHIKSLVLLAGVYIFADSYEEGHELVQNFVPADNWQEAQPYLHVDGEAPPTYIIHGENDKMVDIDQSRFLSRKLTKHGVETRLFLRKNMNHISLIMSLARKNHALWDKVLNNIK